MNFKGRFYSFLNRKVFIQSVIRGARYRSYSTLEEIKAFQTKQFNVVWQDAFTNIPFYMEWKKKYNLPEKILCLNELDKWPILTKKNLQVNKSILTRKGIKPKGQIKTGGSTGEPLHLPTWTDNVTSASMWLGRGIYGIQPGDKTFLIWGHHHLYGKDINRLINITFRRLKDWLSNMKRVSAYDLSKSAMKNAFNKYKIFHPSVIIGFSPSVLSFVRINKGFQKEQSHFPKAVICTAGPLSIDEKEEIQSFFNAPVCMEYGSAECGVMAYTEPITGQYITSWDTHLIQGIKDEFGELKNIVTRLTSCYLPLIRYDIGDYLEIENSIDLNTIIKIKNVNGRPSDMVHLKDGTSFVGALVGDCVKQVEVVTANQLHVFNNCICIHLVALNLLSESDFILIKNRLKTVVPELVNYSIIIKQVEELTKTVGGKTPLVVQHKSNLSI